MGQASLMSRFLVLAGLALAVLLVQPICNAHENGAGDPAAGCVALAGTAPADFDGAALPSPKPPIALAAISAPPWRATVHDALAVLPPDPLHALSRYHARSARILS
jgi:hypothetical protein